MDTANDVWVELEYTTNRTRVRVMRGRVNRDSLSKLISGKKSYSYLTIRDCYWFEHPDDIEDEKYPRGRYFVLGEDLLKNFTGEMHIKTECIQNIAVLHGGLESENSNS